MLMSAPRDLSSILLARRALGLLAGGLVALVVLSGCATGGGSPRPSSSQSSAGGTGGTGVDGVGTADAADVASCAALPLDADAQIPAADLAACVRDARIAAGTGRSRTEIAGVASTVQWRYSGEQVTALLIADDGSRMIVTPDDGWVEQDDGSWTHADAEGDSAEVVASYAIAALRTIQSPEFVVATIGAAPGYVVTGRTEVTVENGDTRSLWEVVATGPFEVTPGYPIDALKLYFDDSGMLLRQDSAGTGLAGSGSATAVFSGYGATTDLEKAAKDAGVELD